MKNVEKIHSNIGAWRVPISGMPPLTGWAVQYGSGMESEIKAGWWLSEWNVNSAPIQPATLPHSILSQAWNGLSTKSDATAVSDALRKRAGIETRVVKI
jgi:hypothetical protein